MKSFKVIYLLSLILLAFGCNKEESDKANLIGKIIETQNGDRKIIGKNSYDNNGLLKESWFEEDFYSLNEKREYTYSYNSDGQLIKKEGYEPGNIFMSSYTGAMGKVVDYFYDYDSLGRVLKIKVDYTYQSNLNLDFSQQATFLYPEDSIVIVATNIIDPVANTVSGYLEYDYNSKGNIEKATYYNMFSPNEKRILYETEYTYDSKKAPFCIEPGPLSKNNKLTETITYYYYDEIMNQSKSEPSIFTYEYTYNADDYPVYQVETSSNGIKKINYFIYQ
jgi:hypothetical protein